MQILKRLPLFLILLTFLSSCESTEDPTPLQIDYPAAYVINGQDNSISVIKLSENKVTETIDLKDYDAPHHVYMSPDKKLLAVAITSTDFSNGHGGHGGHGGHYYMLIIDAVTAEIVKTLEMHKMPHNGVFSADGSELWVGQAGTDDGQVFIYNTDDWSLQQKIEVGKSPSEVTLSADGKTAFVANTGSATVTVIDVATKEIKETLNVGLVPVGAWPGSNGQMFVDSEGTQTVSVIDVASTSIVGTINLGFKPGYVAYNGSTDELWVSDATNGKVVIYRPSGNRWTRKAEAATGLDAHAIVFSDDMKLAYVTNQGAHNVSVLDATTYSKITDIPVGRMPNGIILR